MASSTELRARWAYAEFKSSRFGQFYRNNDSTELGELADRQVDFDQLPARLRLRLVELHALNRREFGDIVDAHHTYVLDIWSKGRLCQASTMVHFGGGSQRTYIPYLDFLHGERLVSPDGAPDANDPRTEADSVPQDPTRGIPEWGCIAVNDFPNVLIDGYLRSVLFMRDAPRDALLPVWVGLGNFGWRAQITGAAATQ